MSHHEEGWAWGNNIRILHDGESPSTSPNTAPGAGALERDRRRDSGGHLMPDRHKGSLSALDQCLGRRTGSRSRNYPQPRRNRDARHPLTGCDGCDRRRTEYMMTSGSETMQPRLQNRTVLQGAARQRGQGRGRDVRLEKQ